MNQTGVVTQFAYDNATGAMVQKIADAGSGSGDSSLTLRATDTSGMGLVTDYQSDSSGRVLREFGPVHEVQLRVDEQTIEAAMVRTMKYTVYRDDLHQVWNASGYARGNGPNYTFVTVGAVHLTYNDEDGRVTDEIEAIRESNMGPLSEMETFPRNHWRRWTHQNYDVWGRLLSQRVYYRIPESGDGERNYNYNETCYGYDNMGRQNRVVSPGGTITRTVFDSRGLTASQWVGTNDTGATDTDPTGGGAPGNNMVQVLANEYDNGEDMRDGLLTQVTRPVDDTSGNDRVVEYSYDFRDRLVDTTTTDGITVFISRNVYDNLDRVIGVDTYHTSVADGNLTGRTLRYYDTTGRVYREEIYAVDPDSGTASLSMVGEKWYDPTGKLVRQTSPGSEAITLLAYDSLGREVMRYLAYEPPSESSSSHPSSDSSSSSSHHSSRSSSSSPDLHSSSSSSSHRTSVSRSSSSYHHSSSHSNSSSSHSARSSSFIESSSSIHYPSSSISNSGTYIPPPPSCPPCSQACTYGPKPVRLSNGQISLEETDLSTQGFVGWAHTRSYGNLLEGEGSGSNGNLWLVVQLSSLVFNVGDAENCIVATRGANSSLWFQPDGSGGWQPMFTERATLVHDVVAARYTLTTPEGYCYVYFDDSMAVAMPLQGRLESYADPYGLTIMLEYDGDYQMVRLNQTDGFQSNVFVYSYLGSDAGANAGQMERVALEINDVPVREVLYSYFNGSEPGGGARDLKRVIIRDFNATTSTWATVRRTAYRYYTSSGTGGFAHGLKYELRPESYNQMTSAGLDPLTASDAVWASYADKYFEYDSLRRAVLEKVDGGRETYTMAYTLNPDGPGYDDNNIWYSKTTETRPNGTAFTVYANKSTRTILSKLTDADGNLWFNYMTFNEQGRVELQAMPSAVESVIEPDETSNTLTVILRSHEGLVKVNTYYASTDPATGAVATYLESEGVKEGADGDLIITRRLTYASHTVDGVSIYPLASSEVFPVAGEAGNVTVYDTAYYSTTGDSSGLGDLPLHPGNELDLEALIVVEQGQTTWNEASEQILSTQWQRFDDATGTGELHGPDDSQPKARRSYQATWFDGIGRQVATADYGTNGGMELVRPPIAPARSDIVLVATTHYRDEGEANATKDANGIETRWQNDDAGRRIRLIENFCIGVAAGSPDANRTTEYAYAPDGGLCRLTLINAVTGDQVTRWEFGTTLADSKIARSDLLRTKLFPSSNGTCACGDLIGMQRIQYSYNRQGQVIEMTDPNSTVHAYDFDGLGRTTQDRVTALGTGIDASVRRIQTTYDLKRQLRSKVTSYDDPVVGVGAVLNEVAFDYDSLAQLAADRQAHAGPVDLDTPSVLYHNDIGYHNSARRQYMVYPDGVRVLNYDYGPDEEAGDRLSRVQALSIAGETDPVCRYTYMGSARCVDIAYPQPGVELSYRKTTDAPVGDAGDPYNGYDRFGRTVDMRWLYGGNDGTVLDRIQYGYDRASNRTWRKNLAASSGQDQAWTYDGLYQVKSGALGTLNINQTAIGGVPASAEAWNYDPTGNWQRWQQSVDGETQLDQSRISNRDNQITQIDGSCDGIAYDKAGNTLLIPPDAAGGWSTPQALVWDAWNRLVAVNTPGSDEVISEYAYDGLFRRIMKLTTAEIRHYYFNDQWKCLEERTAEPPPPSSSSEALSSSSGSLVHSSSSDPHPPSSSSHHRRSSSSSGPHRSSSSHPHRSSSSHPHRASSSSHHRASSSSHHRASSSSHPHRPSSSSHHRASSSSHPHPPSSSSHHIRRSSSSSHPHTPSSSHHRSSSSWNHPRSSSYHRPSSSSELPLAWGEGPSGFRAMSRMGGGGRTLGVPQAETLENQFLFVGSMDASVSCQYVWGARTGHRDELILRDSATPSSSSGSESSGEFLSERLWCLMDYYDPTSIVDNSGAVVERYRFSAFGLRSVMAPDFSARITSDYAWDFAFKGQFLDLDTGYYNYGYRYYSPELGRWLSRDPIGEDGGMNLYVFTENAPQNLLDAYGLISTKVDYVVFNNASGFEIDYEFCGTKAEIFQQDVSLTFSSNDNQFKYELKYSEVFRLIGAIDTFRAHDQHIVTAELITNLITSRRETFCGENKKDFTITGALSFVIKQGITINPDVLKNTGLAIQDPVKPIVTYPGTGAQDAPNPLSAKMQSTIVPYQISGGQQTSSISHPFKANLDAKLCCVKFTDNPDDKAIYT